ncbi:MAG: carbonic anhydrase [Candidatus Kryptoniota bacterium]
MKKIFQLQPITERSYQADAIVLSCFDYRFSKILYQFFAGQVNDYLLVAGGVKHLASPEHEEDARFVVNQINVSLKLHQSGKIVIVAHNDCGAYGGKLDRKFYIDELKKGEEVLRKQFNLPVQKFFMDLDGSVYEV